MDIKQYILSRIKESGSITPHELVKHTGKTRQYVHKIVSQLINQGLLVRIGQTRDVKYVSPGEDLALAIASRPFEVRRRYSTKGLDENDVFKYLEDKTNILDLLPENVFRAFRHGFTEMLNNAIDHSDSKTIEVIAKRTSDILIFTITDAGVGIFKNIQKKFSLANEQQAMLDVIKGKLTTLPGNHSGQGIFFTSRVADKFSIESSQYWLLRDNNLGDTFFKTQTVRRGTKVTFEISTTSSRDLTSVFNKYSSVDDGFTKTDYRVKLYRIDNQFVSRSQAKKLMHGLDKFEVIELDFNHIEFVGQGFVDEVFRVWQNQYPKVQIKYENAIPEVVFMIKRVLNEKKR